MQDEMNQMPAGFVPKPNPWPDAPQQAQPEQEQHKQEPVAHVLFRQDDDGLEPIMFYPPTTAPDPQTLKDRFILKDVWLSPPQRELTDVQKDAARWRWLSWHIKVAWDEGKFTSLVRIVSDKDRESLNASIDRMMAGDWSDADAANGIKD